MARAVQRYMGLGVCDQYYAIYRSRSEVNPCPSCAWAFQVLSVTGLLLEIRWSPTPQTIYHRTPHVTGYPVVYGFDGLRPLGRELYSDNGHFRFTHLRHPHARFSNIDRFMSISPFLMRFSVRYGRSTCISTIWNH